MLKKRKNLILLFILSIIPIINVNAASSVTVHNQQELKDAIADSSVTTIELGNDIETTEKITTTRNVTIDGNGHTIRYIGTFGSSASSDNKVWGGIYVLQIYKSNVTIRNIKLTGGNAALLVNGGKLTLEGVIDVSGNGFGGIELGQGKGVDTTAHLTLSDNAQIVDTTESSNTPTLWVPSDSENAILEINGVQNSIISGDEVLLQEIKSLISASSNIDIPETADPLGFYIVIGLIAILSLEYSAKKIIFQS